MLQEGIYHEPGTTPPPNFGIMFLRVSEGASAEAVGGVLARLWTLYRELKAGRVPGLPGITIPHGSLNVLIGYGPNVFGLFDKRTLPRLLGPKNRFRSVAPGGGNPLLAGAGLSYEQGITENPATEEIVVQFLGDTPLAVNRPMVETWKLLQDTVDPQTGTSLLQITAFFTGFHREDRRSWIDFHDGLSNPVKGDQRLQVITIKEADTSAVDAWVRGGTTMTFMRLPIDLAFWNRLSRTEQELLVGREKVSGCALERVQQGVAAPVAGCPLHGREVTEKGNEAFREPPDGVAPPLKRSHVQRANNHREDFDNPESLRIYRQGYEFAESVRAGGAPRVGLNFVTFHDSPFRVIEMLTRPEWLGGVNFGGDLGAGATLIRVAAAGIFLVPPVKEGEPFPGAEIFLSP